MNATVSEFRTKVSSRLYEIVFITENRPLTELETHELDERYRDEAIETSFPGFPLVKFIETGSLAERQTEFQAA